VRQALAVAARKAISTLKPAALLVAAFAVATAVAATPAAANSKYAAIVVDANTGKTLFSSHADEPRYPASLTKMMTLYLVFEALESGRISKSTKVPFSKNAAAEPPTKLGVRAGGSVTVETVILSLVTKSANDASTAVAELLGGSEAEFARMMTSKARKLGMTGTIFRNANGLPNGAQHTTARDMATLGIALREHFPQYYDYFSTRSFTYNKRRMGNHNRLLGKVKGVDGIKTGYTRASGFNLVSSVADGNRRIVAVVMGGRTGASRDAHMAELIKSYLPKASSRRGGGDLVAKAGASSVRSLVQAILPKKNAPTPQERPDEEIEVAMEETIDAPEPAVVEQGYAAPIAARMADIDPVNTASVNPPSGWVVQVASSPSEVEARAFLARTNKVAPGILAEASGFTVTFEKDGVTYYRARYGGFGSKSEAWNACSALKKKKVDCYAVQQ
jgi:D-alanyl-D-alanine carboxypeptidase